MSTSLPLKTEKLVLGCGLSLLHVGGWYECEPVALVQLLRGELAQTELRLPLNAARQASCRFL